MQQAIKYSANISSMATHKLNENITIKMNSIRITCSNMIKIINTKTNKRYNKVNIHIKVRKIIMARAKSIC